MAIQIKICGIDTANTADAALRAGADLLGLVLHPKSPRNLMPQQASSLAERIRGRARIVAMVCNPDDEMLARAIAGTRPDFIQLHGSETPERVGAIRGRFGVPLIKALPVAEPSDLAALGAYEDAADMLLFDARPPAGAQREGGNGVAFDWQILRGRKFQRPWLLSGGLNAENVARAIGITDAPGVDVSSGVESAPGVKDAMKIAQFVEAARNAQFGAAA